VFNDRIVRQVTGDTLRPGGFQLTDRAMDWCSLRPHAAILDVGCGNGATVRNLREHYEFQAFGIDLSPTALQSGKMAHPSSPLACANSSRLPFPDQSLDAALVECSLSVMNEPEGALGELNRALVPGGWIIITDIYARNPGGLARLRALKTPCYFSGAHSQEEVVRSVQMHGFDIEAWQDCSEVLKLLTAQLILNGGLDALCEDGSARPGEEAQNKPADLMQIVAGARLGYYLLIARKERGQNSDSY